MKNMKNTLTILGKGVTWNIDGSDVAFLHIWHNDRRNNYIEDWSAQMYSGISGVRVHFFFTNQIQNFNIEIVLSKLGGEPKPHNQED